MAGVLCLEDIVEDEGRKFPDVVFRPLTPQIFSSNYIIWRKNQVFSRAARIVLAGFEAAFGEESDVNFIMPVKHNDIYKISIRNNKLLII